MATRAAAAQKKIASKSKSKPKPKPKPKPKAAPKPKVAPAARVTVPVANNNGTLVSPETWQQDQARLAAAREDQDALLDLNDQ